MCLVTCLLVRKNVCRPVEGCVSEFLFGVCCDCRAVFAGVLRLLIVPTTEAKAHVCKILFEM